MFDPYGKRRARAISIREKRMGAIDFSLPIDGDVPLFRSPISRAGDFMESLVKELVQDRSAFFDEVVQRWKSLFPDLAAKPGKWVAGVAPKGSGKLFIEVGSAPALFSIRPKLPSIKRKLSELSSAPERFSLHLEIARPSASGDFVSTAKDISRIR